MRHLRPSVVVSAGLFFLAPLTLPSAAGAQDGADFFTVPLCRLYDTRWGQGPLVGGFDRWIPAGGYCGIPPDATAAHLSVTTVDPNGSGLLSVYPCCSLIQNIVQAVQGGRTLTGNAVLGLGTSGKIAAFVNASYSTTVDLVVDVSGYFRLAAPVQQWQEWEAALQSPTDYTANGGDPYSEVQLDIRFSNAATGDFFLQPAFWDGDDLMPKVFKVRTALPAGSWTWQIASCTRSGVSCLSGWIPSQGWIYVQSNTSTGNPLYDRGFVEQVETVVGGQTVALSELKFPDGTAFTWVGDTAWTAPPREYDPPGSQAAQTTAWEAYLDDRKSKGFTAIQIAPAVAWTLGSASRPLPVAKGFSFAKKTATCPDSTPMPDDACWRPVKAYWENLKSMIKKANDRGLLVAVIGVMNPTGIDPDGIYPTITSAQTFAKYLWGLLGGRAVIFSPAFDDDADKIDPGTGQARSVLMNAVGNTLKTYKNPKKKPRPLTNHLSGGSSNCDEYIAFATQGWMTHYMFQSGHGGSGDLTGPCAPTGTTDVERAMERARVMSLTLTANTNPKKLPAINAEGPYDSIDYTTTHPNVDKRYRVRQAGYLSALSNAVGYSYGANGLALWDKPGGTFPGEPSGYFVLPSATDMGLLKSNLLGLHLVAHHEWIKNNPTEQRYKMVLATDEVSFVMAYLPGDEGAKGESSDEIKVDANQLPCHVCPSRNSAPWSFTWVNPVTNNVSPNGSCSGPNGGQLTFKRPACIVSPPNSNPDCDWLLRVEKTGTCPSAVGTFESNSPALETWSDTSAADGTSAIYATLAEGPEEPLLLSPAGKAFQLAPRVGRVGDYDLVVWQADGLDGSLYGVYGALLGPQGEVTGPFKINSYTEHDQREPAVAGGAWGNALVVWSSYGQDGDQGGIFGRLVEDGTPIEDNLQDNLGEEIELTEERGGHQQRPQVVADAEGFWVAWETVDEKGLAQRLSVRRLGIDGRPESPEVKLPAESGEQRKLLTLDSPNPGSVVVRWWRQDSQGRLLEPLQQVIGPRGPLSPVAPGT